MRPPKWVRKEIRDIFKDTDSGDALFMSDVVGEIEGYASLCDFYHLRCSRPITIWHIEAIWRAYMLTQYPPETNRRIWQDTAQTYEKGRQYAAVA